jgi:CspA family cold shock protein
MPSGTVKWYNPTKRFGFIEPEEGDTDIFVHVTAVEAAGLSTLQEGQKIQYELATGEDGRSSATDLVIVEG